MNARGTDDGFHAVIMAGGSGARFWPYSRRNLPKQFLPVGGEKSLLRQTFERLEPLATAERTWVITNEAYVELVAEAIPELPRDQILGEPVGRNTAPCIGLAANRIAAQARGTSLLVCPADHVITPPETFHADLLQALRVLQECDDAGEPLTITFGIAPRYAATGFGYIERGKLLPQSAQETEAEVHEVARFLEKPVAKVAEAYVASGQFYWNSGIVLWSVAGVQKLIRQHLPELDKGLRAIDDEATSGGSFTDALKRGFASLPAISIDYGVLERTSRVAVVGARFEWDDVGSWAALDSYAPHDEQGNAVLAKHLAVNTSNCLVVSVPSSHDSPTGPSNGKRGRLIATIGVEGLVIVETDDAVLVCPRDQTERVKEIVEKLGEAGFGDLA